MKPRLSPTLAIFLAAASAAASGAPVDFNREIRPILSDKCFMCHGPDEAERKGDLRLDTREGAFADLGGNHAIVPGDTGRSELVNRITTGEPDDVMPPLDSERSLSTAEKDLLERWIAEGAKWAEHWAFVAPERKASPKVSNPDWCRNGIDRFVLARLEEEGLEPSPEADRATLIRRLSLDLTGMAPTPEEVDAFLADERPDAYGLLVDRLLDSPRYGEAMALPWLDAARYADTDGYQNDGPREMWRWRDWVIDAYNANMPFDRFTIEQLAGDLLENPTLEQLVATGFNRNHRYNSEAGLVLEEFLLENAVDRVDTASTIFMGLTMGCARCHDHKFDPFSQKEYYQLISFFNSVPESGRAVKFGNSEPWIVSPTKDQAAKVKAFGVAQRAAEAAMEKVDPGISAAVISWAAAGAKGAREGSLIARGMTDFFPLEGDGEEVTVEEGNPVFGEGIDGKAVTVDGSAVLKLGPAGQFLCQSRYSLAFWMRPDAVSTGVILSKQTPKSLRPGLAVEMRDGRLQFYSITRWIAGVGAVETEAKLAPGDWVHVVLTNDGSQSATGMEIFLNGKRSETRILHNTNSNTGGSAKNAVFRIGGGVHGDRFTGAVDSLRIYDRTLWEDEIALLAEPEPAARIAKKEPSGWTEGERRKMRQLFLEAVAPGPLAELEERRFTAREAGRKYRDSLPTTMIMREMESPQPTHVRIRGVYHQRGEEVSRGVPRVFPEMPPGAPPNRLGFARWLASGEHPLTARVAVNRYWQKYFGRGLVKTAEDFGLQGEMPSHPQLLDWLASEFVRIGWNVKAMQKLIVTSATYRQSSVTNAELRERDPLNVLLARGPRQRLSAHALRDQALQVAGLLVERIGGPSVSPYQPAKLWETMSNMKYEQSKGEDLYRRSLYTIWKRTVAPPSMAVMDAADRESCIVSVKRTNTPLQALTLLNETAFVEAARSLGERILKEGGESAAERVDFGFRVVSARPPKAPERALLEAAYSEYRADYQGDETSANALIRTGESKPDPKLDPVELAAATTLANVLLNLDEVITKE